MKKEYDLRSLKKREQAVKTDLEASKTPISIRLDAGLLAELKSEAYRLGIPYQTFISSILYRYATGELVDSQSPDLKKLLKSLR